jgi:hypothetical protein
MVPMCYEVKFDLKEKEQVYVEEEAAGFRER